MPIQLSGSLVITGSITTTGVITMSGSIASASYSSTSDLLQGTGSVGFTTTASFNAVSSSQQQISASLLNVIAVYATTGSNSFRANQSITGSLVVSSTITAQTLVVQTVTSSIVYSSGSNNFGNQLINTQTFTGSVNITGSNHTIFGNVGIGITNPSFPLEVSSSSTTLLARFTSNQTNAAIRLVNTSGGGGRTYSIGSGDTGSVGAYGFYVYDETGASTVLAISASGWLGLGTNNPAYGKLSIMDTDNTATTSSMFGSSTGTGVNAAIYNLSTTVGSSAGIRFTTRNSGAAIWAIANLSTGASTGDLVFGNGTGGAGTEKMRITSVGEVLMNTTSVLTAGWLCISVASNNYNAIVLRDTGTAYSSGNYYQLFTNSSNGIAGGITHPTTSTVGFYTGPSDQRLKSNIKDFEQPVLPLFNNAKLKTYNHIADEDESVVYKGFLAQDMVDNFPEAYGKDKDGYYMYNPTGYIPYLVKAIQELSAKVTALETK
jgi:hypothetical protein